MNPADMSNEQLAWELEKPCGGRENGIEFDLLQEAARRLRAAATVQEGCVMNDKEINDIARKYAELIEQDDAAKSPSVPTVMARINGAIREAASTAQPRVATIDEAQPTVENMERAMGQVDEKAVQDG